ncbi:DUF4358 domain-containing protein [Lederbergia wuyishanensis]|uniref:DUF4358 domain-containing protein n=1 Tax=Lederbergia wuyishanensis TaxID=1347903 RepID=A0ABU0D0J6_9BACI|nr:DUF4358 domain-containing protein [Lederbergia wuyishanensis]MCJ8006529.1 DUF4358 domain-containing protein [Lederbergia wuyishanensis]MDQ0341906.1 hypothetical protein [Lederbergia wuyishanensis]
MKKALYLTGMIVIALFTLIGCSAGANNKEGTANISLEEIVKGIKEKIAEDLEANGVQDALKDGVLQAYIESDLVEKDENNPNSEFLMEKLNIDPNDIEEGYIIAAMMNVNSDEIILLKAKDDSKVDGLIEVLKKEKEAQVTTWEQYLPDQYEKVNNNIIKVKGPYLIYITYEQPEKLEKIFDEKLK